MCLGCDKFEWPVATRSLWHGTGGVGGRPSARRACPLPAAALVLPAAELEHRPCRHGARRRQAAQLREPCHGGHSRQNVWGKYRSFCSPQHAGERGVMLRLCLPARGGRHLAPAVLARSSRLWHGPSRDLPSRAGIGRAGDATCIPPSRTPARPLLSFPGASAWAGGGEHGSLASSQGALSPARSLGSSPTG